MAGRRKKFTMPLIPVRGLVIFPYMVLHFDVARPQSIAALEQAMAREQKIFLVAQKDAACDSPTKEDLYTVGTVSKIKQILKLPKDTVRVLIEGETRAALLNVADYEPFILGEVRLMDEVAPEADDIEAEAMVRQIRLLLDDYFSANNRFPEQTMQNLETIADAAALADAVAANVILKTEDKQAILEEADVKTRLFKVAATLSKEIEVWSVERQVLSRVKGQMDKNQRDYFLREQMKAISIELGEKEDAASEADEYLEKMQKVRLSEEAEKKCRKEISRLRKMPPQSQEGAVIKAWLDTVLELPWQVKTDIIEDLDAARAVLERDHYGLAQVKDRIIEYLAVQKLTGGQKGSILCLVGPPGVGKTSVARSIAQATGRNYVRVSLGGVRDEAEIRGHRKTYIGSMPGAL